MMPTDDPFSVPQVTVGLGNVSPGARAKACDVEQFSGSPGICVSVRRSNRRVAVNGRVIR